MWQPCCFGSWTVSTPSHHVPVLPAQHAPAHRFCPLPGLPLTAAGTQVAVKVRHPNVSEVIERDFALMMSAAKVGGRLINVQSCHRCRAATALAELRAPPTAPSASRNLAAEYGWPREALSSCLAGTPSLPICAAPTAAHQLAASALPILAAAGGTSACAAVLPARGEPETVCGAPAGAGTLLGYRRCHSAAADDDEWHGLVVLLRHGPLVGGTETSLALVDPTNQACAHVPSMQVDLAREATHLHAFNYNFRSTGGQSSSPSS